ncbi:hypothetical protein CerSpe_180220 [Prunus speciosa]
MEEKEASTTLTLGPATPCPQERVSTELGLATPCPQDEVSTELTLWTTNKKKRKPETECPVPKKKTNTNLLSWLKPCDAWEIKKTLTPSDLENLLIVETNFIENQVMSFLGDTFSKRVLESKYGARVTVHDRDTFSKHRMVLKLRDSPRRSYILDEDWQQEFVKRRELKEGDEIGVGWYTPSNVPSKAMFIFSVLKRAGQPAALYDQESV